MGAGLAAGATSSTDPVCSPAMEGGVAGGSEMRGGAAQLEVTAHWRLQGGGDGKGPDGSDAMERGVSHGEQNV